MKNGEVALPPEQQTGLHELRAALAVTSGISAFLGLVPVRIEVGSVTFSLVPRPEFANPLGTVHGGILATLLDSAVSCAVHSALENGDRYTTISLTTNYVRAGRLDDERFVGEGHIVHLGRRIATAEGTIITADGRLLVHGSATCMVLPPA